MQPPQAERINMKRMSTRFSLIQGIGGNKKDKEQNDLPSARSSNRKEESQAEELFIENERLKTTLGILTQKLKMS